MKKIINPWKGMEGYNCFGCAPNNEAGVKMEFYEDGDEVIRNLSHSFRDGLIRCMAVFRRCCWMRFVHGWFCVNYRLPVLRPKWKPAI